MTEILYRIVRNIDGNCAFLAVVFLALVAIETLAPCWRQRPSLKSRLKSGVYWIVFIAFSAVLLVWPGELIGRLGSGPLFPVLRPPGVPEPVATGLAFVAAAFVGDFFYYWTHRAQHAIPWLWRFHATHHSVREMSGMTAYHHVSEPVIKAVLYSLPLSFVTHDPLALPVAGLVIAAQGHYIHSPTKLNLGVLGYLIQDNRFHRVHHSTRREHLNKNFGVFTTLWDVMFGTAVFLQPGEWPETGVEDVPEPETIFAFLLGPFGPAMSNRGRTAPTA
jgi:sterol desaturase/sphingolipid hydroxylase (fatty acid hydroxylase superfamily)